MKNLKGRAVWLIEQMCVGSKPHQAMMQLGLGNPRKSPSSRLCRKPPMQCIAVKLSNWSLSHEIQLHLLCNIWSGCLYFTSWAMYKQEAKDQLYCLRLDQYLHKRAALWCDVQGPLAKAQVEAFLDDHPDFIESYVLRKVERWVRVIFANLKL